jgi:hypothetical protein
VLAFYHPIIDLCDRKKNIRPAGDRGRREPMMDHFKVKLKKKSVAIP